MRPVFGDRRIIDLTAPQIRACLEKLGSSPARVRRADLHARGRRGVGKNYHLRPLLEACRKAKVQRAVAFHELRHTYASHLAQAGVDLLTIPKLLGHADTRITSRHYAHLADKTLAAAVTKLPGFAFTGQRENLQAVGLILDIRSDVAGDSRAHDYRGPQAQKRQFRATGSRGPWKACRVP